MTPTTKNKLKALALAILVTGLAYKGCTEKPFTKSPPAHTDAGADAGSDAADAAKD